MLATATKFYDWTKVEIRDRRLGVADLRKINLRTLIARYGGPSALAKKLGYSNATFISQMIGPKPIRPLSEKTCRKIETALELPPMWMDQDHEAPKGLEVREPAAPYTVTRTGLDTELLRKVAQAVEDAGIPFAAAKFGDVVTMVYEDAISKGGAIDPQYVVRVLRLAK